MILFKRITSQKVLLFQWKPRQHFFFLSPKLLLVVGGYLGLRESHIKIFPNVYYILKLCRNVLTKSTPFSNSSIAVFNTCPSGFDRSFLMHSMSSMINSRLENLFLSPKIFIKACNVNKAHSFLNSWHVSIIKHTMKGIMTSSKSMCYYSIIGGSVILRTVKGGACHFPASKLLIDGRKGFFNGMTYKTGVVKVLPRCLRLYLDTLLFHSVGLLVGFVVETR